MQPKTSAVPFLVQLKDGYVSVSFMSPLTADLLQSFSDEIFKAIQPPHHIFLDFKDVGELPQPWIRVFMQAYQKIKADHKHIRIFNASDSLLRQLKDDGLIQSLKSVASLRDALVDVGLMMPPQLLDVNFINPFLTASIKVLEMQASTKAHAGKIYKKNPREKFMGDISGVIGLVSEAFTGSVVISFPAATFVKIMSRMLGEEIKEITKEIEDGAGELTNIIFGQAKISLNDHGFGIKTALPSVITGSAHSISQLSNGPRMVIPFESDAGPFFIEICVSQ